MPLVHFVLFKTTLRKTFWPYMKILGCVTSHQTHANARKHTQTHANTRKHTANTRKHTQTHRKHTQTHRKHTQTQTANTVQLPKPLFRFNKSSKGDSKKKKNYS